MDGKLLTPDELKKIGTVRGRKLELNAEVYVKQLLEHIAALTPKQTTRVEKPVEKPVDEE